MSTATDGVDSIFYVTEIDDRTAEVALIGGPLSEADANELVQHFHECNPDCNNLYAVIFNLRTGLDGVRNIAARHEAGPCLN